MSHVRAELEASYDYCRHLSRRAGSNFHAGFLLLPKEKRRAMEVLYAFMRHTDDLADADAIDGNRDRASASKSLQAWRNALEQAMQDSSERPPPGILSALVDVVQRFRIPAEHLRAVIDGVEMDLSGVRYQTFPDLEQYCERVASAVGLACLYIWGFRGPEAFEPARQVGVAMQLTNILRDVKADAAAGRVYLPEADMHMSGYSVEELLAGKENQGFRTLMGFEINRAERLYDRGVGLWDWLEPDGRRIFGFMLSVYRALLRKIARRPSDVLQTHLRLSKATKLRLLTRWSLLPPRKASLR